MGSPCSKYKNPKKPYHDPSSPTSSTENDEPLEFKVEIGSIKARNLPPNSSYLRVKFGNEREFKTPEITTNSNNYSWTFHEEFKYSTTRRGLKEDSITLILMSNKPEKEIGTVTINLIDIATGPSHQYFEIKLKKGKTNGRLSFDVKMSQIISLTVRAQSINCKLNAGLREKFYNFSLKMNIRDREFFSEHSANFKNLQTPHPPIGEKHSDDIADENYQLHMDENKKVKIKYFGANKMNQKFPKMKNKILGDGEQETSESSKDDDSLLHNLTEKKPVLTKALSQRLSLINPHPWVNKKDIVWTFSQNDELAPALDMNVSVRDLASGSFQFFLWANKEGLNKSITEDDMSDFSSEEVYIDHKLVGECCIGANKIFYSDDATGSDENNKNSPESAADDQMQSNKIIQRRKIKLVEKLLYHGESEGELVSDFVIEHPSFYRQMIFGVRTEKGIERSRLYHIKTDNPSTNTNVNEIKILRQHKEALKSIAFNLFGPKITPKTAIKLTEDLATNILKVLEILKTSHQESLISILYKTPETLLLSQKVLIGLTKHVLETCDIVKTSLRPKYYETLLLLIHRPEFELNYMGFDESYNEFLKNAQKTSFKNSELGGYKVELKNIQQKLNVCESYQSLLYLMLQKVLSKLSQRGLPEKEREFVEQFTAIAYFRIPEFRKKLLECLKKDIGRIPILESRGTEWRLDDHSDANKKNQHFISLFDWEGDFYVYLRDSEKGEANRQLLNEILEDKDWQHRLSKRGIAFYSFLNEWAKHVNKTVVTKEHVPWQDLPGYSILIKCFLVELKLKDVKRYPQLILDTSYSLLKNEKLLDIFIAIIYSKTRVYESGNVFAVFELINNWFTILRENKRSISPTFDYNYFFKGVVRILEGEHALNMAKVLWVLYNNFNLFPYNEKEHLCEYMFGPIFFKLFLHWSWSVRQVFHHLLLYRFYHQHRTANTNLTNLEDLKKELLLYNQRRENYKNTKKLLINDFINMEYSRHMTIIENAYKKLKGDKPHKDSHARPGNAPNMSARDPPESAEFKTNDFQRILKHASAGDEFSSGKKGEYFPKLKLIGSSSEKQDIDNVVDDFFEANERPKRKQSLGESSYWLINPDNLEISVQAPPMVRPSRSESYSWNMEKIDMGTRQEDINLLDMEMEKVKSQALQVQNTKNSMENIQEDEKKKEKKKVILRRLMYYDKQTNKLKEIPKEYAVYLEVAYKEYETVKIQYLRWCNEAHQTFNKLPEESLKKMKADPKVPELNIKIPLDDGEDGQDLEEW